MKVVISGKPLDGFGRKLEAVYECWMQITQPKTPIICHIPSQPVSKSLRVTMQVVILGKPLRGNHLWMHLNDLRCLIQALLASHVTWLHHSVSTSVKRDMSSRLTEQTQGVIDRKDASATTPALKTDGETYLQLLNKQERCYVIAAHSMACVKSLSQIRLVHDWRFTNRDQLWNQRNSFNFS